MSAILRPPAAQSKYLTYCRIFNCYYYMSSQITTSALVDFFVTIVMAMVPFIMFKVNDYLKFKGKN